MQTIPNHDAWKLDNGEPIHTAPEAENIEDRIADAIDGPGVDDVGSVHFTGDGYLVVHLSLIQKAGTSDAERLEYLADDLIEIAARVRCLSVTA